MTDWDEIIANDFEVPAGGAVPELAAELCALLGSPDPRVRDEVAYVVLAVWTGRGVLDGNLAGLGDRLIAQLDDGPVYQRTFAAISLAWVVLRDARTGELSREIVLRWLAAFSRWWRDETDLRAWDHQLGWLHAPAHGADALRAFGRSDKLAAPQLRELLDLALDRLKADRGYLYGHGEDDRSAYAIATVLTRPELPETAVVGWLGRVQETITSGTPGPVPPWAANTLRTLAALYVFADRGVTWYDHETGAHGPPALLPHAAEVKHRIAATLRVPWRGLG